MAVDYPAPETPPGESIPLSRVYGLMAEFDDPDALLAATRRAYAQGYRNMDAYTPYPVEGLSEALHMGPTRLPLVILAGGLAGAAGALFLQYYATAIAYPLNVGGRPLNSWPAYVPIAFEVGVLLAAFAAVLGMFLLNGLPQPYHPVFNVPSFELATRSHFFLAIESRDPAFTLQETRDFLESLDPIRVSVVEI
jgi:hypothetical protein